MGLDWQAFLGMGPLLGLLSLRICHSAGVNFMQKLGLFEIKSPILAGYANISHLSVLSSLCMGLSC